MHYLTAVVSSFLSAGLVAQGAVQPCSTVPLGQLASGASHRPAVTPDGRWLVFCSAAADLVASDTNARADVFVRDRATGAVTLVSVDDAGNQANGDSWSTAISADGRFVCFLSLASNLVPGDTNNVMDGFVRDRENGTTRRVTVGTGGAQATDYVDFATICGDGSVAVYGTASALVPGDTNGQHDVFVHTLATGVVTRVSVGAAALQGNGNSFSPAVAADGRFVAFHSQASNLVPNDTNNARDIFVHDRQTATTERVSVGPAGLQANADSRYAACSADGNVIAFVSFATNLVPNDTNTTLDVFVRDRVAGTTERVSVSSSGAQGFQTITSVLTHPSVSADGRYVAFYSPLDGLDGPTNALDDAFVHDRSNARTLQVSRASTGEYATAGSGPLAQFGATWLLETMAIASGPAVAVFSTLAGNLVPQDGNGASDVFAVDAGLRCTLAGPATPGGSAVVDFHGAGYAGDLFVGTFATGVTTGTWLPTMQWLPLDDEPLLLATLCPFVVGGTGAGSWALAIPPLPGLAGATLHTTAVGLDFAGPTLFAAIGNVVTFVIQ